MLFRSLFAIAGERVGAGNPRFLAEQEPRSETAPALATLLAAGAEVTGLASTDEFAYSLAGRNVHYGTPPNPRAPDGLPGGSTSGPATAVALGRVAVGLGTDTAGSIRVPASYQGLVGIRTTHGAVPTAGVLPLAPTFDTVGWLTRDVGTARRVAEVLFPGAPGTVPSRTLVLPAAERHARADVAAACADRRTALAAAGVLPAPEDVALMPEVLESWLDAFRTVQGYEAWQAHGDWVLAHPGALGADVAARFALAARITGGEAEDARGIVGEARAWLSAVLDGAVLVVPSSAGGAPARDAPAPAVDAERVGTLHLTCLAGLAGAPAVSTPVLRTADGRPAGLCVVGAPGSDLHLLGLAAEIESVHEAAGRVSP